MTWARSHRSYVPISAHEVDRGTTCTFVPGQLTPRNRSHQRQYRRLHGLFLGARRHRELIHAENKVKWCTEYSEQHTSAGDIQTPTCRSNAAVATTHELVWAMKVLTTGKENRIYISVTDNRPNQSSRSCLVASGACPSLSWSYQFQPSYRYAC